MGSAVKNYSTEAKTTGVALYTTVTIGYDAPWRRVHELLIGAALATRDIIKDPAPYVLQTALNDFYVAYELNVYTRTPTRMANIYSELHQNIQDKFNEGGIEINSPHYATVTRPRFQRHICPSPTSPRRSAFVRTKPKRRTVIPRRNES
jgi:small-conductance mechanosensitive channel